NSTIINNNTIDSKIESLGNSEFSATKIDNENGLILSSKNILINSEEIINNKNGIIKSNKNTNIDTETFVNYKGKVVSLHNLELESENMDFNESFLFSNKELILRVDKLDNVSTSTIIANEKLTIRAKDYITNSSDIIANGELNFETDGAFTIDDGITISSTNAFTLKAGSLVNDGNLTAGSDDSKIEVKESIINNAKISSSENLFLKANDITNNGLIVSQNDLTLESNNFTNNETLFSANDMNLYTTNTLSNTENANIIAMNNITFGKNDSNEKTKKIVNTLGTIETFDGDINVNANSFLNIGSVDFSDILTDSYGAANLNITKPSGSRHRSRGRAKKSWVSTIKSQFKAQYYDISADYYDANVNNILGGETTFVDAYYEKLSGESVTTAAIFKANGNINFNVDTGVNKDALLESGSTITFDSNKFTNEVSEKVYTLEDKNYVIEGSGSGGKLRRKHGSSKAEYQNNFKTETKTGSAYIIGNLAGAITEFENIGTIENNNSFDSNIDTSTKVNKELKDSPIVKEIIMTGKDAVSVISDLGVVREVKEGSLVEQITRANGTTVYTITNENDKNIKTEVIKKADGTIISYVFDVRSGLIIEKVIKNSKGTFVTNIMEDSKSASYASIQSANINSNISIIVNDNGTVTRRINGEEFIITQVAIKIPDNKYGLFIKSENPQSKYLIETNPELSIKKNFISSDYLMERLEFSADITTKRVGDAFYENKLIRESIMEQTGKKYLSKDIQNDNDQFQYLMQNSLEAKDSLNLISGISLSQAQLNALTRDIVWMEEKYVAGEIVLVPTVYIANLDNIKITGAQIYSNDVNLDVDTFKNTGLMNASNDFFIDAKDSIFNTGQILVTNLLKLISSNDITNNGQISAADALLKSTNGSILNETLFETIKVGDENNGYTNTKIGKIASITSTKGNLILDAKKDIINTGASLKSAFSIGLKTQEGDVTFKTIKNETSSNTTSGRNFNKTKKIDYIQSSISSNDSIIIESGNDVLLESVKMKASNTIGINAKNDLNITAVNTLDYKDTQIYSKGSTGKSTTKRDMTYKETVVSSELSGANIVLNAKNELNLESAKLNAKDNIFAKAKNVNIVAKTYKEGELHYTKEKGLGGLSTESTMDKTDALKLKESELTLEKSDLKENISNYDLAVQIYNDFKKVLGFNTDTEFINNIKTGIALEADEDITIIASSLDSKDKDINLTAQEDVLIASANEITSSEQWSKKQRFNIGNLVTSLSTLGLADTGPIYVVDNKEEKTITSKSKASNLRGNNIIINAGSATVMGSNVEALKNIYVKTDIGSIKVIAAQDSISTTKSSKKIEVSMSGITEMVKSLKEQIASDETKIKVEIGKATYDAVNEDSNEVTNVSSILSSKNGNIILDSSDDMLIEGSNLLAKNGTIALNSQDGNIVIKEALDTLEKKRKETHGEAKVSASVQNEYVEIKTAVDNLLLAKKAVKTAKRDQKKYKKDISNLENTLVSLKTDLINKVSGVDSNDIEELIEIIDDMKSDASIYKAAIVASLVNVATKTTALIAQTAAAATSVTYGFSAGITLDLKGNKKQTNTSTTTSLSSNLTSNNLIINTSDNKDTTIQGSNV
ncbi:MAG: hemagglutinin repeat-containing protein, partial [Campylobacteraceae bacterium]|nr:hemagglutinin repeat-containing protein [Campylobacteraceae bacterium]